MRAFPRTLRESTDSLSEAARRFAGAVGFLFAVLSVGCFEEPPRSVLLVTIDTLRADALSLDAASGAAPGPLRSFARLGARFEWAFSTCSYTVPAHASIMVGRYPSFHSVGLLNGQHALTPDEETLAEMLGAAGYRTAAITSNASLDHRIGLDQGFETYDDRLPDRELVRDLRERRAGDAVDRALEKLRAFEGDPFFLWLHLQDPHGPYTPPAASSDRVPRFDFESASRELPVGPDHSGYRAIPMYQAFGDERRVEQYAGRYQREVDYADRELGRLFEYLQEGGRLDDMLVLLTSDHGESMGEDDFYFQHGHSVGLEQVHVPLLVVGADVVSDRVVSTPVTTMDIFATVLEFLEQPIPNDTQSRELYESLRRDRPIDARPIYTESYTQTGIVDGGVYLRMDREPAAPREFWRESPLSGGTIVPLGTERIVLIPSTPDRRPTETELERRLGAFRGRAHKARSAIAKRAAPPVPRADIADELRALGYVE